ncbi:MAG TPA: hypothetical protein VFX15_02130, partial [Actinomycetes bacterium]|nr:hypothetical protein [Actinomycetes bacterium]
TPDPNATPTPVPSPTPTPLIPPGQCLVPGMLGQTVDVAKARWEANGFKPAKLDVTVGPDNYIVGHEDIGGNTGVWDGTIQNCNAFTLRISP